MHQLHWKSGNSHIFFWQLLGCQTGSHSLLFQPLAASALSFSALFCGVSPPAHRSPSLGCFGSCEKWRSKPDKPRFNGRGWGGERQGWGPSSLEEADTVLGNKLLWGGGRMWKIVKGHLKSPEGARESMLGVKANFQARKLRNLDWITEW